MLWLLSSAHKGHEELSQHPAEEEGSGFHIFSVYPIVGHGLCSLKVPRGDRGKASRCVLPPATPGVQGASTCLPSPAPPGEVRRHPEPFAWDEGSPLMQAVELSGFDSFGSRPSAISTVLISCRAAGAGQVTFSCTFALL